MIRSLKSKCTSVVSYGYYCSKTAIGSAAPAPETVIQLDSRQQNLIVSPQIKNLSTVLPPML